MVLLRRSGAQGWVEEGADLRRDHGHRRLTEYERSDCDDILAVVRDRLSPLDPETRFAMRRRLIVKLTIANEYLSAEVERLRASQSMGYVRRRPGKAS